MSVILLNYLFSWNCPRHSASLLQQHSSQLLAPPLLCHSPRKGTLNGNPITWLADKANTHDHRAVIHFRVRAIKVPGGVWQHDLICTTLVCRHGLQAAAITMQRVFSFYAPSFLFSWGRALFISSSEATLGMKTSTVTYRTALSEVIFKPFPRGLPACQSI